MRVPNLAWIGLLAGLTAGCAALNQGDLPSTPDAGDAPPAAIGEPGAGAGTAAEPASAATTVDASAPGGDAEAALDQPGAADTAAEASTAASAEPGVARPGDMLSAEEIGRAESLALQSASVKGVVGAATDRDAALRAATRGGADAAEALSALSEKPTYRVIYAQRYPDKDGATRSAEVAVYRYDTGQTAYSKVDLATGAVEAIEMPADLPVPIVPEEIEEAAAIARADDAVRQKLTAAGLDPDAATANALLTVARDPNAACARHRCLRLFFGSLRNPVPTFEVVVDMVALAVVETTDMPGEGLNP